jgi:hypothetical protein
MVPSTAQAHEEAVGFREPPLRFRQTLSDEQIEAILKTKEKPGKKEKEEEKPIFCKNCNHKITSIDQAAPINGQHRHTFKNPAGIVYTIGCFITAWGCVSQGIPTDEHTWFPGFSWNFSLCGNCYRHLGWFYQANGKSFYGLILNNLT